MGEEAVHLGRCQMILQKSSFAMLRNLMLSVGHRETLKSFNKEKGIVEQCFTKISLAKVWGIAVVNVLLMVNKQISI